MLTTCSGAEQGPITFKLVQRSDLIPVWSGHPVGFALLTDGDWQFAAFYDANRHMNIARRKTEEASWQYKRLPTTLGWDSHNYVTLALDRDKILHVSGNMHCVPLIYFRADKPYDIESLERIPAMVGTEEKRCTYPRFLTAPGGEFLFTYRDGSSGNGNQIWNVYDPDRKTWSRLLDSPMFDGQGKTSAYYTGPKIGPDGCYHLCWMWRDTSDCSTNHDLSYMKSRDLKHWTDSDDRPLVMPVTLQTGEIVDGAEPGQGLINPAQHIGFDLDGRVILSYGKYDERGNYQIYNARRESDGWKIYRTSDWSYRWEFQGKGSIAREISFGPVESENGKLTQNYRHIKEGNGEWVLDEKTLKPIGNTSSHVRRPGEIDRIELDFPGIRRRTAWDIHDRDRNFSDRHQVRYVMRWESQGSNRDRPHPRTPPPTMLRVFTLESIPRDREP